MKLLYVSDTDRVHDRRFVDAYRAAGIKTTSLAVGGCADPVAVVAQALEDARPDVVHAGPMTTAAWATLRAGAPTLASMSWGSDVLLEAEEQPALAARVQAVADASALVQCDSAAVERVLVERYAVPPERIVRFPWGIDPDHFTPGSYPLALARRLGVPDGAMVVLSTRNFEPVYDIPTVLAAFEKAHAAEPRLHLLMLGHGSGEEAAHAFVAEHGLARAITFVGQVDHRDLPDFFRLADAYLSCSRSDGASISLLEALATGVPPIASDIEANREWITPAQNGWLAPVGEASAFAEALLEGAKAHTILAVIGEPGQTAQIADWVTKEFSSRMRLPHP